MPRIPQYELGDVTPQPLPGVRVGGDFPISAVGGGRAFGQAQEAARSLLDTAESIAQEERRKALKARLAEEDRAFFEWERQIFYDPKTGAFHRKGKDAFSAPETVVEAYRKFTGEREKELADPDLRLAYREMVQGRFEELMRRLDRHVAQERHRVTIEGAAIQAETAKERAALDPAFATAELVIALDAVLTKGRELGWDKERIAFEMRREESDLHRRVIEKMLSEGRDIDASRYFGDVRPKLDDETLKHLAPKLRLGAVRGQARRIEDEIFSGPRPSGLGEALQKARELAGEDGDVRDEAVARVRTRWEQERRAQEEAYDKEVERAARILENTNGDFDFVPDDMWQLFRARERAALMEFAAALRKPAQEEEEAKAISEFWVGMSHQDRAALKPGEFLIRFRGRVSKENFEEMAKAVDLAKRSRVGDPEAVEKYKSLFTTQEMLLDGFKASRVVGVGPTDDAETIGKDEKKKIAFGLFKKAVDARMAAYHADTGRNPDDRKKKEIIDQVALLWAKELQFVKPRPPSHAPHTEYRGEVLRRFGELVDMDPEDAKFLKDWRIRIDGRIRREFYNLARSKPGAIPVDMDQARFEYEYRDRINRAYLSLLAGASDADIAAILEGR